MYLGVKNLATDHPGGTTARFNKTVAHRHLYSRVFGRVIGAGSRTMQGQTDKQAGFSFDRLEGGYFKRSTLERVGFFAACAILWVVFLAAYLKFLPLNGSLVGPDYSLFFPNLLTGYYWYLRNGLFEIPWFSPSQCAGFPFFSDPNVPYFSVPQFMTFFVSPMTAVQITFALFSLIGFVGAYWLMRRAFLASRSAAFLAGVLFLFNGFFISRMLVGHLTFHPIALAPVLLAAILPPGSDPYGSLRSVAVRASIAAACLAYMFQAGMVHGIPPVLITAAVLILIHGLLFGQRLAPWLTLAGAGAGALLLSAGKLVSEFALLANLPRDFYPLPGIPGFFATFKLALQAVFFSVPGNAPETIANSPFLVDRHEFDSGVSAVPLVLIAVVVVQAVLFNAWRKKLAHLQRGTVVALLATILLLIVPVLLNWYEPGWNAFLKSLPYLGNSSNLVRFFSAYMLVAIVLAALALDHIRLPSSFLRIGRPALAAAGVGVLLIQQLAISRSFEPQFGYDIGRIEAAYARSQVNDIQSTGTPADVPGGGRNDAMVTGRSQVFCYQPLLGYQLEKFKRDPLQPGQMLRPIGDVLNVKNPACYIYPAENGCQPGDHFKATQLDAAKAFLSYRPFPFELPASQKIADWLSLLAFLGLIAVWVGAAASWLLARRRAQGATVNAVTSTP